jgi:NADPH:quinone reductase-like Zn-dependent oxidoreductase
MRAAVLREFGEPAQLRLEELADPEPSPGQVVVELKAAALNRRDTYLRRGSLPTHRFTLPLVLGSDGAGIRRDTGEEVVILPSLGWGPREDAPAEGFQILGGPTNGTYAELVAVPADNLYPKPRRLTWPEAASFPLAGLTAYRALFARGRLGAGETLLVLGAGSGVSTFAVMLAGQAAAKVIVTSSSDEKLERARGLGAQGGVNYTRGDWAEEVRALTGGRGVDLVLDSVGSTWADSLRSLRPGGRLVVLGATGGPDVTLNARQVYSGQCSILGTTMGSARDFAGLLDAIQRGTWKPVIDSVRPLGEAASAHERMEAGAHFGKLVLETA